MMEESKGANEPRRFKSKIERWTYANQSEGATPFGMKNPSTENKTRKKSVHQLQNEEVVKDYRKLLKKKLSGRQSGRDLTGSKPQQLMEVFEAKKDDLSTFEQPVYKKSEFDLKRIMMAIKTNSFFDNLSYKTRKSFSQAFEPIQVSKDTVIIQQGGENGDYFYIIGDGEVEFKVDDVAVGSASSGQSFGELALLYSSPRAATVLTASMPTKLFRVDKNTFRNILHIQIVESEKAKTKRLQSVPFFKDLDESDIKRLGEAMAPRVFEAGDCLVKKGGEGVAFYIIEGELEVGSKTLKADDFFGELALATSEPNEADVTAKTKGIAFSIDQKTFEKVLGKFSRLVVKSQDKRTLVRSKE
jgi:cAMP-dependent protein kinase regulator